MKMNIITFYVILLISVISNVSSETLKKESSVITKHKFDSEECNNEIKNSEIIKECMSDITLGNYKQKCTDIKSKTCQDFYNDSNKSKYFPICSKDPEFNELLQPAIINGSIYRFYSQCFFDEENKLCPYAIYSITGTGGKYVLSDNCISKQCTDLLLEQVKRTTVDDLAAYENLSFNKHKFSYQEIQALKDIEDFLESDKCKSKHITSDAFTNRTNIILSITLFLLLVLFY